MSSRGLIRNELKRSRMKGLILLLILVGLAVVVPMTFDFTVRLTQNTPVPNMFRQQADLLKNFDYFAWSQWFGKNLFQAILVFTVLFGGTLVTGEVSRHTVSFLLTKPISRQQVFAVKYLVNLAVLALAVITSTAVFYIAVLAAGRDYPLPRLVGNTITVILGLAVIYSLAAYFSTVFDRSSAALGCTALTALALSLPGYFPPIAHFSLYYQMQGVSLFKGEGFPVVPAMVMIAISAGLYWLGRKMFVTRDF